MWRGATDLATCAVLGLVLSSCEGKRRPWRPYVLVEANAPPNASVNGASGAAGVARTESGVDTNLPLVGGQAEVAPGSIGAACRQGSECDEGNCIDGLCCDSPCTELCAACNLPGSLGVCSAMASDPLCPEASCQGQSSECRPLANGQAAVNCEAVGACRTSAECTAVPAALGTLCQRGTGTCDGQGACLVPDKNALGQPCVADSDCGEGHCVASIEAGARVCCDAACDGVCQACSAAGRCEVTPSMDSRCSAVSCPADNVCRDYVEAITDNLCRSLGQCRSDVDCVTANFFTNLRPSTQCVCDPSSESAPSPLAPPASRTGSAPPALACQRRRAVYGVALGSAQPACSAAAREPAACSAKALR
jgi:hypothetical protein